MLRNARTTSQSESQKVIIAGGSNFGRYNKINSEKTYNMMVSDGWLVNFAGYSRVSTPIGANLGEGRGAFRSVRGNFVLAVFNSAVYRFDPNLYPTKIGNLDTASGEVFIDENLNNQICIVDGINAYIYYHTSSPNLTKQTLASGLVPNYVQYHNTFFLIGNGNRTGSGALWYAYQYNSNTTISEATELSLQTKPDYALAILRIPGQANNVLVFGSSVCEIFTQVGGTQNYRRNSTINIDYGCLSVSTIAASDKVIAWLGVNQSNSPVIMTYTGQGAQALSTYGIDYLLSSVQYPQDSTANLFKIDGHLIYALTFFNAADNFTIAYDFTSETFINLSDDKLNYFPARQIVYFNGTLYFVSLNNTSLYKLSTDITVYDENAPGGSDTTLIHTIPRIRITNTIQSSNSGRFRVNNFEFTMEQGTDPDYSQLYGQTFCTNYLITEDGDVFVTEDGDPYVTESGRNDACIPYTPRIDVAYSKDGGITYGAYAHRNLNFLGHRQNIMHFENMGMCNNITLKIRFQGHYRFIANNGTMEVY